MSEILKPFAEAQLNSVEHRHAGRWPAYGDYLPVEFEEGEKRHIYVVRTDFDPRHTSWYSPLREPVLFIEFAELFDYQSTANEEVVPTVLDWVKRYGALGANRAYEGVESRRGSWPPPDGVRVKVHGTLRADRDYPFVDSRDSRIDRSPISPVWPPPNDVQWVDEFVTHALKANLCWQLLRALKARGGPDEEELRELLGSLGLVYLDPKASLAKFAMTVVDEFLNVYLSRETCIRRYHLGEGKTVRGPGFVSLLGALYLQMSNFRDAEEITYCKWCGDVVNFEQGDPPPSDAPKGTRGKHRTHSNREFCKEKHGVMNYCKNKWHYAQRKKAKEPS